MDRSALVRWLWTTFFTVPLLAAPQELPAPTTFRIATARRAEALPYVVQLPAQFVVDRAWPLLVLLPDGATEAAARAMIDGPGRAIAGAGFLVVSPAVADGDAALPEFFAQLRQTYRIDQGGMHAAGGGAAAMAAIRVVQSNSHEFQTLTVWGGASEDDAAAVAKLHERRVRVLKTPVAAELVTHFVALHKERQELGVSGDVARTLDDFHDAAAKGDETRYFAILPEDAVFLGTDPNERWTGVTFKSFALPYFERGPAWTYVPIRRWITVADGGALAWFDEILDNQAYGECRGGGVMELRAGKWVLRQYDLTVPVPNELMRSVVDRIRAFAAGRPATATTVVVVRHAEKKGAGDDPDLSEAGVVRSLRLAETLAGADVAAVYTSEFKRTAATAGPLCQSKKLQPKIVPAADATALAARLKKDNPGRVAVVVGHSNTVPAILKALGVKEPIAIGDDEYDRMFVVTLAGDQTNVLSLRYGGS